MKTPVKYEYDPSIHETVPPEDDAYSLDHMNAHLHRDGSIQYEHPCTDKKQLGAPDA
jgi:hypothetical protein